MLDRLGDEAVEKAKKIVDHNLQTFGDGTLNILPTQHFFPEGFRPSILADEIMKFHHFKTAADSKEIYVYEEGVYIANGEVTVLKQVEFMLREKAKKNHSTETIETIKRRTIGDVEKFDSNIINVKNGLYNVAEKTLEPHDPEVFSITQVPIKYKPDAKCERILEFFNQILPDDNIPLLQEIFGFCLYRSYFLHKIFLFHGTGSNGKSTVLSLLRTMLGSGNISSRTLQDLAFSRFSVADLYGKLANICPDIPSKRIDDTAILKSATGEDMISAEKKHKDSFSFINTSKLIFSANLIPSIDDETDAMVRRIVTMEFPYSFLGSDRVPDLFRSLSSEEEMQGLLMWSLEGLHRLIVKGDFSYPYTVEENFKRLKQASSSVSTFIDDFLYENDEYNVPVAEAFDAYRIYCTFNKIRPVRRGKFSDIIKKELIVTAGRPTQVDGTRPMAWEGLGLRRDKVYEMKSLTERKKTVQKDLGNLQINTTSTQSYHKLVKKDVFPVPDFNQALKIMKNMDKKIDSLDGDTKSVDGLPFKQLVGFFALELNIEDDTAEQLLIKLSKEGLIFETRPGWWKRV